MGKIPVTTEVFTMQVKCGTITGRESFRNLSGMPSGPRESLLFMCFMVRVSLFASLWVQVETDGVNLYPCVGLRVGTGCSVTSEHPDFAGIP